MAIELQSEPGDQPRYDETNVGGTSPGGQRWRPILVLGAVALLVAAGAFVVVQSHTHTGAAKRLTLPVPDTTAPPSTVAAPNRIAVGGPTDGLATRRLPITVTPFEGLSEGQLVTIHGSEFPPGVQVAAVMCTLDAGHLGVAACDIGTSNLGASGSTVAPDGTFTFTYPVRETFHNVHGDINCAGANIDPSAYSADTAKYGPLIQVATPGAWSCIVAVGDVNDYDQSGGAIVSFAGENFAPFEVDTHPTTTATSPVPTSVDGNASTGGRSTTVCVANGSATPYGPAPTVTLSDGSTLTCQVVGGQPPLPYPPSTTAPATTTSTAS
jgi:hypothetical protein